MTGYRYSGATKNDPLPETCGDKRGTPTGFGRHDRAGERPCDECRLAKNASQTAWRAGRPRGRRSVVSQRVRQRALNALAREYPDDFRRLLDVEWIAETKLEAPRRA